LRREGAGTEAERAALLARAAAVIPTSGFHRSRQADFINVAAGAWFVRRSVFHRLNRPVRDQILMDPHGNKH
jgi:hypothetical protein